MFASKIKKKKYNDYKKYIKKKKGKVNRSPIFFFMTSFMNIKTIWGKSCLVEYNTQGTANDIINRMIENCAIPPVPIIDGKEGFSYYLIVMGQKLDGDKKFTQEQIMQFITINCVHLINRHEQRNLFENINFFSHIVSFYENTENKKKYHDAYEFVQKYYTDMLEMKQKYIYLKQKVLLEAKKMTSVEQTETTCIDYVGMYGYMMEMEKCENIVNRLVSVGIWSPFTNM